LEAHERRVDIHGEDFSPLRTRHLLDCGGGVDPCVVDQDVDCTVLQIELVDAPGRLSARAPLMPIIVPEKVSRYHTAARRFRDSRERHEVSRDLLPRATRIIHAIAIEAERRGWSALASPIQERV
jgi:hypothetical protein